MKPRPEDVGEWELERYRLGELPAAEAQAVRSALEADETVQARLAALERSEREILSEHPPAVVGAAVRARLAAASAQGGRRPWRLNRPALAFGFAVLVGAAAVLTPSWRRHEAADTTRIKGLTPKLLVFRESAPAAVELLAPGSVAHENDVLQLAYQAAGRRFGAIVSVDARGVVTRHLPATGSQAILLKSGGPATLERAYRLDDAPGFERFYLVTADEPFSVDEVVAAVRRQAPGPDAERARPLELPPSLDQFTFVLKKETAR